MKVEANNPLNAVRRLQRLIPHVASRLAELEEEYFSPVVYMTAQDIVRELRRWCAEAKQYIKKHGQAVDAYPISWYCGHRKFIVTCETEPVDGAETPMCWLASIRFVLDVTVYADSAKPMGFLAP